MTLFGQGDLFADLDGSGSPSIDAGAFERGTDHRLDEHSWITHVPRVVTGSGQLLSELSTLDRWEQRQRWMYDRVTDEPRLTAEYADLADAPTIVVELVAKLSERLDVRYDGVWMNWYRDHTDGTGWHADRPANKAPTAAVPVLTLGAARRFLIRRRGGGASIAFTPGGGDLLIMRGRCQRDWEHCVPKQRVPCGARMSLDFSSLTQS